MQAFIEGRIGFPDMFSIVEATLAKHEGQSRPCLEEVIEADQWARKAAEEFICKAVK